MLERKQVFRRYVDLDTSSVLLDCGRLRKDIQQLGIDFGLELWIH
jgi:hypothetical protein